MAARGSIRTAGPIAVPGPMVFIVGSGRCGSTLVQDVLTRHPDVAFLSNLQDRYRWLDWTGRWNRVIYRMVPERLTRKGRVRFAPSEGYRALAREVSPFVCSPGRPLRADDAEPWLAEAYRRFFDQRASRQPGCVFLQKFTGWPRVDFTRAVFPDARFIHVVRDGRAVANSLVQMPWWRDYADAVLLGHLPPADLDLYERSGRSVGLLAGLVWKSVVDAHEQARRHVPYGRWLTVRYEDVVARPAQELDQLRRYVGLVESSAFDRAVRRTRVSDRRAQAYEVELGPRTRALLDDVLGDHLARYGYSPRVDMAAARVRSG